MNKCLYCYGVLQEHQVLYHEKCIKKFFGSQKAPLLEYTTEELHAMALRVIQSRIAVTGVQPKLSLALSKNSTQEPRKLTIVGMWGDYILKPPSQVYPHLPENEDLSMHLASLVNIAVVPHSLIQLPSNHYAYITKRIDRFKKQKIHMEDLCQITGRLTEDKYKGSMESIANAIMRYSATPGYDMIKLFRVTLFSYVIGNSDMHLKNFSMINTPQGMLFSDSYDLLSTKLVLPADTEEIALSICGKKKKLQKSYFITFAEYCKINPKAVTMIFNQFKNAKEAMIEMIDTSFLNEEFKEAYRTIVLNNYKKLFE